MTTSGFFTRGVKFELPHPPIPLRLILIVHAVIRHGLELLRESPPEGLDFSTVQEDILTFHLHWVIANRLYKTKEVRGFDKRSFGKVWREPKVTNCDGSSPDKMPDLVFDLNRDSLLLLPSHDALFVECKPVDANHSAGEHYCDKGIRRFVFGDYAWTMQQAMMVAYVRDNRSIGTQLTSAISKRLDALHVVTEATPVESNEFLSVSLHSRRFAWPEEQGNACDVSIFHSWHVIS